LSVESLAAVVVAELPDADGAGEGGGEAGGALPEALAELFLRRWAKTAHAAALTAALNAGAEARRLGKERAARTLDAAYTRLQLYLRGAREVSGVAAAASAGGAGAAAAAAAATASEDDDPHATLALLARHAVRTTGAECLDALLRWCELEFLPGDDDELAAAEAAAADPCYSPAERPALLRRLSAVPAPSPLTAALRRAAEQLSSAGPGVGATSAESSESAEQSAAALETALEEGAGELGLRLRRLDKKAEKAAVMAALAAERASPAAALALALPLLVLKATRGKAVVSVPGRAIAPVLARLRRVQQEREGGAEDGGDLAAVASFHERVVAALRLRGGAGGGGAGNSEAAERAEAELLRELPALKAIVGLEGEAKEEEEEKV